MDILLKKPFSFCFISYLVDCLVKVKGPSRIQCVFVCRIKIWHRDVEACRQVVTIVQCKIVNTFVHGTIEILESFLAKQMSLIPKPTLTDYTFLASPKNRSYFLLSRQKEARDHVRRKWSTSSDETKTPRKSFDVTSLFHLPSFALFFSYTRKHTRKGICLIKIESKPFTKSLKRQLSNGLHFDHSLPKLK